MTNFHEGQEVEVARQTGISPRTGVYATEWCKAKIVRIVAMYPAAPQPYQVQFPDGTRATFNAEHIRPH